MGKYIKRTLVSRNIDCASLTVDEFVKVMYSDLLEAEEKYNELFVPEWVSKYINTYKDHMKDTRKIAERYAERKWKTEKKRLEYVLSVMKKEHAEYSPSKYYNSISFFDFDVNPGDMGISGDCVLSLKTLTFESLERCFEAVKNNKYFKVAKGWELTYTTDENSYASAFRPEVKLIVDENVEAAMKKEAQDLADDVARFYANCRYPGD